MDESVRERVCVRGRKRGREGEGGRGREREGEGEGEEISQIYFEICIFK